MGVSHLISIVGAGPGSVDLLTVKALNRLKAADVVLYDALLGNEILELANKNAIKIYVGKLYNDGQNQKERQNEIHQLFLKFARENNRVVRLKAGDPMIFGRGAEEIRFCKNNNLNYEVVPGITAGIAASSLFGIPLTERGKNGMSLFYTGQRNEGSFTDLDSVSNILKSGSSAIIYMGLNNFPELAKALIKNGVEKEVVVQILSKISQPEQKSFTTIIGNVDEFLNENKPETPAIIILGKNVQSIE